MDNEIHVIGIKHYEYTCGDGCCYESGSEYFIDGKKVADAPDAEYAIQDILAHFNIKAKIEYLDKDNEVESVLPYFEA